MDIDGIDAGHDDLEPEIIIDAEDEGDEEGFVIQLGDEEVEDEPEPETPLVKQLRNRIRELSKAKTQPDNVAEKPVVGDRPRASEYDYDDDAHQAALDEWQGRKDAADAWDRQQQDRTNSAKRADEERAAAISKRIAELGVKDFGPARERVEAALSDQQKAVLAVCADDPAAVIVVLGKRPALLAELADKDNLAKFAAHVGKIEKDVKIVKRKATPAPEGKVRSGGAPISSGSADKTLEKMEADWERKGGDRSHIIAYKKKMRAA